MMRVLVTGGYGFIGSNFIRLLLEECNEINITNLDKVTYCANPANLSDISEDKRYCFVRGDICDKGLVEEIVAGMDMIVNFAAETHVDRSIKYPDDFLKTNIQGTKTLLDVARSKKISKFIQIGTDEVYGSVNEGLSKETDPLRPNSPYSATKAAADLLALSYHTTYGLPVMVTRSSNNYGPYQYPEKVIPLFITNLMQGKKVPLYGDGKNVRDWIHVKDNCEALKIIMKKGEPGQIYNIGGGEHFSNTELTRTILACMGLGEEFIEYVTDRPGHDRRYALDSSKMKSLGWDICSDLKRGIEETVNWYENNRSWWLPIKEKAEIISW